MKIKKINKQNWPGGISDGLTLKCSYCKKIPFIDYVVSDKIWNELIPKKYRLDVVCFSCFDKLCEENDINIFIHLKKIQLIGINKTIILNPKKCFVYNNNNNNNNNELKKVIIDLDD